MPTRFNALSRGAGLLNRLRRAARFRAKSPLARKLVLLCDGRWRLGDEIMLIPVYRALKARYPNSTLKVLCNYPELLSLNQDVDEINPESEYCDLFLFLHEASPAFNRYDWYEKKLRTPVADRSPVVHVEGAWKPEGNFVAVSAEAGWQAKKWPEGLLAEACRRIQKESQLNIVELELRDQIGLGLSMVGKTSTAEAARILKAASLFVGMDSGLLHLALAVGTPCVALFGPTMPRFYFAESQPLTAIISSASCAGCWNAKTMKQPGVCPKGESDCMAAIAVEEVVKAAQEILAGPKAKGSSE